MGTHVYNRREGKKLEELALFLSEMNKQKESHIGFCGEEVNDIYHTLKEDCARDRLEKIVAAMGLVLLRRQRRSIPTF